MHVIYWLILMLGISIVGMGLAFCGYFYEKWRDEKRYDWQGLHMESRTGSNCSPTRGGKIKGGWCEEGEDSTYSSCAKF